MVLGSWRRSFLQPTRMIGRPAQKWRTSEIHYEIRKYTSTSDIPGNTLPQFAMHTFSWTLSSESGVSMAKQIKMTWESG